MENIASKHSAWKRLVHKFQARRDIPFRKKFFVGYDLHGNTYWEFTPDGNMLRLRRKLEPVRESIFKSDYFDTVPPQWLQWLRRTRERAPTLQELVEDQVRQQRVKVLAQQADVKWTQEKERLEDEHRRTLQAELDRAKRPDPAQEQAQAQAQDPEQVQEQGQERAQVQQAQEEAHIPEEGAPLDPWAEADTKKDDVDTASIKPRR